jgi:Cof subfamily protein (haloacid dehalogenase superfamily)
MAIKALFFDIDGTLVSFKTHQIPESTVDALRKVHDKGVKIFISTGRPLKFIVNLSQIEDLIDGYVTTNGALCFIGNKTICCNSINKDEVEKILKKCEEANCPSVVVGENNIAVYNHETIVDKIFREGLGLGDFEFANLEDTLHENILQMTPFLTPEEEAALMPTLPGCTSGRWSPDFTDITDLKADKGKGITAIAKHEGIDISETMAFGDGGNDNTMLLTAGIGIAMGNANESTKQVADYITDTVDEDGIKNALLHFGVIEAS